MSRVALLLGLLCCLPRIGAAAVGVQHAEPLRNYALTARTGDALAKPADGGPVQLRFNALSRDFALDLEPNARLAALHQRLRPPAGVMAYRGKLVGRPTSWARIVLTPAGPSGLVFDGETLYGIEVAHDTALDVEPTAPAAMFRLADLYLAPGALSCGMAQPADASQAFMAIIEEFTPLAAQGATLNLNIGAVADFEFSSIFGANTAAALLTRFNNVDGIFSEQLDVQITVAEVAIFTTADDPFTKSNAGDLLNELATYRGATPAQDAQGLTHLFTGRDLDGSTAGVAFFGALCARRSPTDPLQRSFGAGLSEGGRGRGTTIESLVAAHEIGHNFGAPHDSEAGACASTPPTFLMAPTVTGVNQFSQCSIAQMQPVIASATCLTPIGGGPNLTVTIAEPARTALGGTNFNYALTVTNLGTDAATAASLTATVGNGLGLLSAAHGGVACTVANQTATCDLGTLGGGTSRGVTLTLSAAQVGTFAVGATATVAADSNPGNNSASGSVVVVPSVDLVVSATGAAVQTDQQTTIVANIDNTADFAATSVAITASLTTGLRLDQATLAGAACSIAGQTISCAPQTIPARGRLVLALTVTGLTAGNSQISVSATANEAERNPGDNNVTAAVSVTAPPAPKGGGGALSWLAIAALAAAATRRKRSRAG